MGAGISVIIPAHNASASIGDQLRALSRQQCRSPWEVVVVDNASADGTRAAAERWADRLPRLVVVDATARQTSGHARNRGAEAARYDRLAFCDADDVVGPEWVTAHLRSLEDHALVTGPVELAELNEPWQVTERGGGWVDAPPHGNGFLPFAMTCNLGTRRELFEKLGGFDEDRTNGNDKVFCWDAQLGGSSLHFDADAVVHYRLRGDTRGVWRRQLAIGRSAPTLYERYRAHGMARSSSVGALRDAAELVLGLRHLGDPAGRARLARVAGRRAGRLIGSVEHRIWYP